jgi:hypothetical protein
VSRVCCSTNRFLQETVILDCVDSNAIKTKRELEYLASSTRVGQLRTVGRKATDTLVVVEVLFAGAAGPGGSVVHTAIAAVGQQSAEAVGQ